MQQPQGVGHKDKHSRTTFSCILHVLSFFFKERWSKSTMYAFSHKNNVVNVIRKIGRNLPVFILVSRY